jgi:phenylpropionate dioxygenase-like ring-hydroxylating dioxygenase large terminal subunit
LQRKSWIAQELDSARVVGDAAIMRENQPASRASLYRAWPRYEAANQGFRNYWYPVIESRQLGRKPKAVKVVGEAIVLLRDGDKVRALHDRCPHRGVPLSAGRREFPGTISCIYHGWTYRLENGELVAALTDGPDSPICGKAAVRIKTYPAEDRAGIIWVYVGELTPPPLEEDVPDEFLAADSVVIPMIELRKGDWRYAMENAVDEAHARYLHRRTPFALFRLFPAYQTDVRMEPTADGKWLRRLSKPVFGPQTYPGVGVWPRDGFWRKAGGQVIVGMARLPGVFYVGHKNWHDYQFFTPVDESHHLMCQIAVRKTRGLSALWFKLRVWSYIRLFHRIMLNRWEDGFIVEAMDCPPERLFRPDVAIVAWRRWCDLHARGLDGERAARAQAAAEDAMPLPPVDPAGTYPSHRSPHEQV